MDAQASVANDMIDLTQHMENVRRRIRGRLIIRSFALIVSMVVTWLLLSSLIDALVRLPSFFRLILLLAGLFLLVRFIIRDLIPSIRFNPPLVEIALRIESALPSLKSRLATAVEFSSKKSMTGNPLMMKSISDARILMERSSSEISSIVRSKPSLFASFSACTTILILVCALIFWNSSTIIGLSRSLLPLGSTMWPSTTTVLPLHDSDSVHPRGAPFMLRGRLTTGDPADTRITVRIDSVDDSNPSRKVVLTPQGDGDFERLVDLDGDVLQAVFMTHDHESEPIRIRLVDPPSIESTMLTIIPPDYADSVVEGVRIDLGTGHDFRSSPETPFLEGSTASFIFDMKKPLPVPDPVDEQWLETTFGQLGVGATFSVDSNDPSTWYLERELEERIGSVFTLVDEHGILNPDEITFTIDVVEDRFPVTVMLEPNSDERILSEAVIPLRSESRDDIMIESSRMIARRRTPTSVTTEPGEVFHADDPGPLVVIERNLDVSTLNPEVGDVIEILSITRDVHWSGMDRPEVTSSIRSMQVIDRIEFMSNIQSQISSVRRNAIRLDELQSDNLERMTTGPSEVASEQARITRRISATDAAIEQLQDRLKRNRLDDSFMEEVLEQSRDLLNMAGRASSSAQDRIRSSDSETGPAEEEVEVISDLQREVRAELSDLITLLDRNQDEWVVSRQLSDLIGSMEEVNRRTEELGRELVGRDISEMSEEEIDSIDDLSSEQMALVDRSQDLSRSLREKGELMDESQASRSEALRSAAERAQRSELSEKMERSSERIDENQMERASDLQNEVLRTLEEMMKDLEQDPAAQAEELARILSDLVRSIEVLVDTNEQRIIELARLADGPIDELESRITTFFRNTETLTRNTANVAIEAGSDVSGGQRIARRILEASSSQEAVMVRVRERPLDEDRIRDRLRESLDSLRSALELARTEQESARKKAEDRRKDEIRSTYLDLSDLQASIYLESSDLLGEIVDGPSRRQTMRLRRLSIDQESIRLQLEELLELHPDLTESLLVTGIHEMVDAWSLDVSETLSEGDIDLRTLDQESMIMDSILNLVSALQDDPPQQETFQRNEQGSQAGGEESADGSSDSQPEPLIPPLAELEMLRALQEQVYARTIRAEQNSDGDTRTFDDIADMQKRLHDLGTRLLEQMMEQDQPVKEGDEQ